MGARERYVAAIFKAQSAHGGVVRRARDGVDKYGSLDLVIAEARKRGFHVIETGGQIVILCHQGALIIHV